PAICPPPPFPTRRSSDLGVVRREQLEQLDQVLADLVAIVPGRPADRGDQARERRLDLLLRQFRVGRGQLGVDVVGDRGRRGTVGDRKSTRLNSSHRTSSY